MTNWRGSLTLNFVLEKARLVREVDEAYYAHDRVSCANAIAQLYDLLDDTLISPRRDLSPTRLKRACID